MKKSYEKDMQLLYKILTNQEKIIRALELYGCNRNNIIAHEVVFDACSMYMSQIGEASNHLTDSTKSSFREFNPKCTILFRNRIDHAYEKVNKDVLKAYIFDIIRPEVIEEIKQRIVYCSRNKKLK